MKLQLALDHPDLTRELEIAARVTRYIDFVEAGTPLLIREGIRAVRELRRRYRCPVVADIKVVDAGEPIAELAFAAGAKVVTVLGCASDEVIKRVVKSAKKYDGEVMADSLGVDNLMERAKELRDLGVDSLCLNRRGMKMRRATQPENLKQLKAQLDEIDLPVYLAGGIDLPELISLRKLSLAGVIIGAAITDASSPADAAKEMRRVIDEG
jgi:3-hexulose-6-phosphate synthase